MFEREISRRDGSARMEPRAPTNEARTQTLVPPCDILESRDEYLIRADVPGVRPEELSIQIREGELEIKAEARAMGTGLDLLLGVRSSFEYGLRFRVPAGVDAEKVAAQLSRGVLSIHLPKAESRKPRQIPVSVPS